MPYPSTSDESIIAILPSHASCPPDDERSSWRASPMVDMGEDLDSTRPEAHQQPTPPGSAEIIDEQSKRMDIDEELRVPQVQSPSSPEADKHEERGFGGLTRTDLGSPSMAYDFSNVRMIPTSPSTYLRAGSKFVGTQQSERQIYDVQVEIKHVDLRESFLCGYLRIRGLTETHPTLTTYFEGELIGSKYSFLTQHEDWGSTDKVDLQHWAKFTPFRPFAKIAKKGYGIPDFAQRENIFMRWKEHFLVPDHRVRTISGASFEGFYYICFNQVLGTVNGIYFHAKSERFQHLELKHVPDKGCFASVEFR